MMHNVSKVSKMAMIAAAIVLAGVVAGCGGGGNSALNQQFQPQVNNVADNFQFQATGVKNVTQVLQYSWQNSGTHASINQSCSINPGSAFVTLRDPAGNAVFSGDLAANGTFTSIAGAAGTWTIQVAFANTSGTVNFRVQMAP